MSSHTHLADEESDISSQVSSHTSLGIREAVNAAADAISQQSETDDEEPRGRLPSILSYFRPTVSNIASHALMAVSNHMDVIIDGILQVASTSIMAGGFDCLVFPDIKKEYSTLYGYLFARYHIVGRYFKSLASIRRRSHIIMEPRPNGDFYAEGAFGFDLLELGLAEYLFKVMGIGPRGKFMSNVGRNTLRIAFTLETSRNNWNPYIEDVCFECFEDIRYSITGFWFLNFVIEKCLEFLTPKIWGAYVKSLEESLKTALQEALHDGQS